MIGRWLTRRELTLPLADGYNDQDYMDSQNTSD